MPRAVYYFSGDIRNSVHVLVLLFAPPLKAFFARGGNNGKHMWWAGTRAALTPSTFFVVP